MVSYKGIRHRDIHSAFSGKLESRSVGDLHNLGCWIIELLGMNDWWLVRPCWFRVVKILKGIPKSNTCHGPSRGPGNMPKIKPWLRARELRAGWRTPLVDWRPRISSSKATDFWLFLGPHCIGRVEREAEELGNSISGDGQSGAPAGAMFLGAHRSTLDGSPMVALWRFVGS